MTRTALALILLFIAPHVRGQSLGPCKPDEVWFGVGNQCIKPSQAPSGTTFTSITITPPPSCEPGWELVMRIDRPGCAWVVKDAIR